jgi:hypothetical protein
MRQVGCRPCCTSALCKLLTFEGLHTQKVLKIVLVYHSLVSGIAHQYEHFVTHRGGSSTSCRPPPLPRLEMADRNRLVMWYQKFSITSSCIRCAPIRGRSSLEPRC